MGLPSISLLAQQTARAVAMPVRPEEEEEEEPLSQLDEAGCPGRGVLTLEEGGGLASLMTQYAVLYSLARRDGRHAFLPPAAALILHQVGADLQGDRQSIREQTLVTIIYTGKKLGLLSELRPVYI